MLSPLQHLTSLLVVLPGFLSAQDVPVRVLNPDSATSASDMLTAEVSATLRTFVDARLVPGATAVITDADQVRLHIASGWQSPSFSHPLQGDEIYWLASITKTMTSTAFMMLVDEGKVDLDDPVSKYLPALKDVRTRDGQAHTITVRHCLTHTSGLSRDRSAKTETRDELIKHMASRPLDFAPGTKWKYSSALELIAAIAENVSGQTFEEFMQSRLFDPVGMVDTTFHLNSEQAARAVRPTEISKETGGLELAETDYVSFDPEDRRWASASGGAFSTAGDLARYAQLILNHGKVGDESLLSERAFEAMTTLQTGELKTGFTPGNGWALGWCVVRYPQHVTRALSPGTFGHGGVYGPQFWIDPQKNVAYILLFERKDIGNSDGSDLREAFQVSASRALSRLPHQAN